MKKTPVVPGKPVVMKTREDEEELVMAWLNLQNTYSDSIRYLIQKEIAENGLRNLQEFIPQFRSIESLKHQLATASAPPPAVYSVPEQQAPTLPSTSAQERVVLGGSPQSLPNSESPVTGWQEESQGSEIKTEQRQTTSEISTRNSTDEYQKQSDPIVTPQEQTEDKSSQVPAAKRPAGKKFGADVASSFAN
ncbi:hypothetical protein [Paenibacillus gansuensis]|uniref:Uncharacterized protein n=1 Tax=Paenibacillus gansuensis TaxID=306542 RepID=A0ABW5PI31_9BACL